MLKGTSATLAGAAAVKTTTRDASLTAKVRKLIFIILSPALPAFTYRQTPAAVKLGSAESFGPHFLLFTLANIFDLLALSELRANCSLLCLHHKNPDGHISSPKCAIACS